MIDRLVELEVLDPGGQQVTHTYHQMVVAPTDRGFLIDFHPELPVIRAGQTLRWTLQGQTFETRPELWGLR